MSATDVGVVCKERNRFCFLLFPPHLRFTLLAAGKDKASFALRRWRVLRKIRISGRFFRNLWLCIHVLVPFQEQIRARGDKTLIWIIPVLFAFIADATDVVIFIRRRGPNARNENLALFQTFRFKICFVFPSIFHHRFFSMPMPG